MVQCWWGVSFELVRKSRRELLGEVIGVGLCPHIRLSAYFGEDDSFLTGWTLASNLIQFKKSKYMH